MSNLFYYKGTVDSVYDGDTLTVTLDLGFSIKASKIKLRLLGINTPEIRTKDPEEKKRGLLARDFVRELCLNNTVCVHTAKKGKYGRYLAKVWPYDEKGNPSEKSINDLLIEKGMAVPYMV